ncbi:MAG: DUF2721 domain-containing protein [Planctomycetes bacterium]|nr:DUF2721 domain-containing protein [Planctomycetota bacterium]
MPQVFSTIQLLVAPVVMISACGLLCLALYNRLAAIVSRARGFIKEQFDVFSRLSHLPLEQQTSVEARLLRKRVGALDRQVNDIIRRAHLMRGAVTCMLLTIACMLICSLLLGLSTWVNVGPAALGVFTLGLLVMLAGVGFALAELMRAIDPVMVEMASLRETDHEDAMHDH